LVASSQDLLLQQSASFRFFSNTSRTSPLRFKRASCQTGQRIDLYAKFTEVKVASIEKKTLRDLSEKDAEAEGGYSLNEFKTVWKQSHTVNQIRDHTCFWMSYRKSESSDDAYRSDGTAIGTERSA
jgi:uncharacterized protein YqfB (UPF0267 family)